MRPERTIGQHRATDLHDGPAKETTTQVRDGPAPRTARGNTQCRETLNAPLFLFKQ